MSCWNVLDFAEENPQRWETEFDSERGNLLPDQSVPEKAGEWISIPEEGEKRYNDNDGERATDSKSNSVPEEGAGLSCAPYLQSVIYWIIRVCILVKEVAGQWKETTLRKE